MKLYKMASKAIEESNQSISIEKIDDAKQFNQYGVNNAPGLVIDNKLVSQGKVLTAREISKLL